MQKFHLQIKQNKREEQLNEKITYTGTGLMLIISVVPTAAFAETGAGTATPQQSNEDLSEATIEIEKIIVEPCKSFCCNNPEQSGNNRIVTGADSYTKYLTATGHRFRR